MTKKNEASAIDKSDWGSGPWQQEPDEERFEHEGFPCLIIRTLMGHLCGYVAVPPSHPWHGKGWSDVPVDVHGGITYAAKCDGGAICHVPKPGESDDVWWLGFDHAHLGDFSPGTDATLKKSGIFGGFGGGYGHDNSYKTIGYVRRGCESLAEQAKAASPI